MLDLIEKELDEHRETVNKVKEELLGIINEVSEILVATIKSGNKIILFGNSGSAADAQHIAAELSGRYRKERRGLSALALTTDTSALTAISNDYGFEYIFARQVEALAKKGDAVIGISTSGNSKNVVQGILKGKEIGCKLIGLSGRDGGRLKTVCDINIIIPAESRARVQEMHILIGHILCEIIENSI